MILAISYCIIMETTFNSQVNKWTPFIFVECKNWSTSVGKIHIDSFLSKAKRSQVKVAILFTMKGITGEGNDEESRNKDLADAKAAIFAETERVVTLVFVENDLERIANGENFINILRQKYLYGFLLTA